MAGRRFTRGVNRGARRQTSWLPIEVAEVAVNSSAVITHSLSATELATRPFTIVRTHVELFLQSDQLSATENQICAFGICVVSDQALAIGVTAVPTPITDIGSDLWFLHQSMQGQFAVNSAIGFEEPSGQSYSLDSKAMRKVNDDQDVILVVEASSAAFGAIIGVLGRLLIKEH